VAKVDELMALCDRLEAQQQERETRHAALARASLARFADAPTPANLPFLFHPSYAIPPADLRKSILTLAFQGDLTNCEENDLAKAGAAKVLSDAATARRNYWSNRHGTKRKYPEPEGFESEDLPRIRSHWMWASIDCLCAQVTDGEHIQPPYQAEGVPMLSAKHVRDGHVTLEGAGLISEEAFQKSIERCKPENGDILIVSVGATTGRSAIVANCPRFAIVRSVLLLKPVIMKEYLLWWLKNPWSFTWMTQASGASAQPHLYIRDLKHMPVPIPPLAEQRRIVAKVEELMALVDALETQLAASRATAANLLSALVAELAGTPNGGKVSVPSVSTTGRRGRPRNSP
jgi:type I restriction enzyme S subunit